MHNNYHNISLKKLVLSKPINTYFIYHSDNNINVINANSAFNAYSASKDKNIIRIQNITTMLYNDTIINKDIITEKTENKEDP